MGRPSKLTPDRLEKLETAIRLGATYELACNYAGVSYGRFREWMKLGERSKRGKFREFYEAIKRAEGLAAIGWLGKIEKAANDGTWQAAAWKLERRYLADYGRTRVEMTGAGGGPLEIRLTWGDNADDDDTTAETA